MQKTENVMLKLGEFKFSVNTAAYKTLRKTSEYRWNRNERIGNDPALQYAGSGAKKISLNGIIYPHYKSGINQIDYIKNIAEKGKALLLTAAPKINQGIVLGKWVIKKVEETESLHIKGGFPQKIEFGISLEYYGEDNNERIYN